MRKRGRGDRGERTMVELHILIEGLVSIVSQCHIGIASHTCLSPLLAAFLISAS